MGKIRTLNELDELLDRELSWRRKELINLKLLHDDARSHHATMLRRAGVALLYAHWEGFVKKAGIAFVNFVSQQRLTYRELKPNFVALGLKGKFAQAADSSRGQLLVGIAEFLTQRLNDRAILPTNPVQTKSNLRADRLKDILCVLGLDYGPYQLKGNLIERLVDQRNNIAHGQELDVTDQEFRDLHKEVLLMIDEFRTQISNSAQLASYRVT